MTALIADIQRASIHDGPGIRTTIFFKGCPMHCLWCHNPECISGEPQMMYYPEKCIGCGCCEKGCYSGARVICGREYTVAEVMEEILQDKEYYQDIGGVTFSGGEPLLKKEFILELEEECRKQNIGCAIETSLILYDEDVFQQLDLIMADLKIWDDRLHKEYTGCSNTKIKEHFLKLDQLGIPIVARTPVIPEINQEIPEISDFLMRLKNVQKYELLPYHPLGVSKQVALKKPVFSFTIPTKEYMKNLSKYAFERSTITKRI